MARADDVVMLSVMVVLAVVVLAFVVGLARMTWQDRQAGREYDADGYPEHDAMTEDERA